VILWRVIPVTRFFVCVHAALPRIRSSRSRAGQNVICPKFGSDDHVDGRAYTQIAMNTEPFKQRLLDKERELVEEMARLGDEARDSGEAEVRDSSDDANSSQSTSEALEEDALASQTLSQIFHRLTDENPLPKGPFLRGCGDALSIPLNTVGSPSQC